MSKNIDNAQFRKSKLKELILKLHAGESQQSVQDELVRVLGSIPYGEVVEVEQELLDEGLPQEEVLKLCDVHSAVLEGNVDLSASKAIPEGHPVDILLQENRALVAVQDQADAQLAALGGDGFLQLPLYCDLTLAWDAPDVTDDNERLGDMKKRAVEWEVTTGMSALTAGADLLVVRSPTALNQLKGAIEGLYPGGGA